MMTRSYRCMVIILFFGPILSLKAQDKEKDELEKMPYIQKKDSSYVGQLDLGRIKFFPFIAPSVGPEIGLMLNLGGLISFRTDRNDPDLQRSSLPFSLGYSTTKVFNLNLRPVVFFKNDKNRIAGDIWMKNMPDNYWGVGFDKAREPEKPDSTTKYQRVWWQVFLKLTHRFGKNFYAGFLIDFNQTNASSLNATMKEDPNVIADGTNIQNVSIGLLAQYDTRDFMVNAYKGIFMELSSNIYSKAFLGKSNYQIIILDYRQYKTIKRPGMTLA